MRQQVRVRLSEAEMRVACHAGVERRLRAIRLDRRPNQPERKYHEQNWFQSDISGAIAEFAVSKLFGLEWEDLTEDKDGFDVLNYQVRSTENPDTTLKVRRRDNPDHNFIFAKVRDNRVLVEGWITGREVIEYNDEIFPDCFTIKNYRLYPITDLPEFPQLLPDGVEMFKPPAKRLGTIA
jgi:hypothetical protein